MAWCPKCRNEYVEGITNCPDCNMDLFQGKNRTLQKQVRDTPDR